MAKRFAAGLIGRSHPSKSNYEYDDSGRIVFARHDDGYTIAYQYSRQCPSGFAHPLFTPNADGVEYYDGAPNRDAYVPH